MERLAKYSTKRSTRWMEGTMWRGAPMTRGRNICRSEASKVSSEVRMKFQRGSRGNCRWWPWMKLAIFLWVARMPLGRPVEPEV